VKGCMENGVPVGFYVALVFLVALQQGSGIGPWPSVDVKTRRIYTEEIAGTFRIDSKGGQLIRAAGYIIASRKRTESKTE